MTQQPVVPTRRSGPWAHPTWLAKLMAGDSGCQWSAWFRSRYRDFEDPGPPDDFTQSNLLHTRILNEIDSERRSAGERVIKEGQGSFRYTRPSGLAISGRPDLIAVSPADRVVTVWDAKSGKPRSWHKTQVLVYLHCLTLTNERLQNYEMRGAVRYLDGTELRTEPSDVRGVFVDQFDFNVQMLETTTAPPTTPSRFECRYCKISRTICTDRIDADPDDESDFGPDFDFDSDG